MQTSIAHRALIPPTANVPLEQALLDKISRHQAVRGSLGELEPLAVRLGLVQNTLKPRFHSPRLVVFAADHGLAVDDVGFAAPAQPSTAAQLRALLTGQLPLAVFARVHGLELTAVDSGVAEPVAPHPGLLARKIAHGTRNARLGPAMTIEQAHAAMRAGMEIGDSLSGNLVACTGMGVGSAESAALVLASLSGQDVGEFVESASTMKQEAREHLLRILGSARERHRGLADAVEILAAVGGFEVAMMTGLILAAASRRRLVVNDGWASCAALAVASSIAPSVGDYCVHSRSTCHRGLDRALELLGASALVELGLETADGTGATLAWPLLRSAAALLTEVSESAI